VEREGLKLRPYLAAAGAAVIFGFSFLFTKSALEGLEPFELLGLRFFLASLFMLFLRRLGLIEVQLTWNKLGRLLVIALLQPILYFSLETVGVQYTSASEAGVVIGLIPVAVAVLARFLLKERAGGLQWAAITATVAGVVLLALPQLRGGFGGLKGFLALAGAVAAAAFYNITSRRAAGQAGPVEVTYVMMWVGALVFNGLVLLRAGLAGRPLRYLAALASTNTAVGLLYLGILSSVGAFFLMNYALAQLSPSQVAVFVNLTPVISILAGVAFGGEALLPVQLLGTALILGGVWGVCRPSAGSSSAAKFKS